MSTKRDRKPTATPRSTRATASLPPDIYQTLQDIAKQKKVSVAWVIRDAAEKYIADQWPLLKRELS
ncbi:MAG: ribbon-helix-helix domain-containing protein [Proteobacteria bacterium]|nr:ribbon-helix-helix protein, CopG family [Burkholderiales bacterium]MCA0310801.1 ribbon-helix-helix domain-containing protein [Pseudomonadota bacterium]